MSPTLEPPQPDERQRTDSTEIEPADSESVGSTDDPFPYRGPDASALPTPAASVVLGSTDGKHEGEPGSLACPACDGPVVNGAGLFACHDCSWTGHLR